MSYATYIYTIATAYYYILHTTTIYLDKLYCLTMIALHLFVDTSAGIVSPVVRVVSRLFKHSHERAHLRQRREKEGTLFLDYHQKVRIFFSTFCILEELMKSRRLPPRVPVYSCTLKKKHTQQTKNTCHIDGRTDTQQDRQVTPG